MTVSDLHALTEKLIRDGQGGATVVASADPEGNEFRKLSPYHNLGRTSSNRLGVVNFTPMTQEGGARNFVAWVVPNAVCLWPE